MTAESGNYTPLVVTMNIENIGKIQAAHNQGGPEAVHALGIFLLDPAPDHYFTVTRTPDHTGEDSPPITVGRYVPSRHSSAEATIADPRELPADTDESGNRYGGFKYGNLGVMAVGYGGDARLVDLGVDSIGQTAFDPGAETARRAQMLEAMRSVSKY